MYNADERVDNPDHNNSRYCFALAGEIYVIYLPAAGSATLDLNGIDFEFSVHWFNPRTGGDLQDGSVTSITGGGNISLGNPPGDEGEDWVILVRKNG